MLFVGVFHCEFYGCSTFVVSFTELHLSTFRQKSPEFMQTQILYLVIVAQFLDLTLIAGLDIAKHLQIAKPSTILKDSPEDHLSLIKGEINDITRFPLPLQLQIIYQYKLTPKDPDDVGPYLQNIIFLLTTNVYDLLYAIDSPNVHHVGDLILV